MDPKIKDLSIFLPTYNEGENLSKVIENVVSSASKYTDNWELLIVNDGSKDNTREIAEKLSDEDKRIRVINHAVNKGYGASLQSGFYNAKYQWISFIDSDGQFDFGEIKNFINKQKETHADAVIGYYKKRRVSFFKIITSKIWEAVVFLFFGLKVKDIDCGFKLISKKIIENIPKLESERGAFVSSELLIKAKKKGFKIVEISVTHYPRVKGTGTGRNIKVIVKSFIDLFRLWRKLK